MTGDEFLKRHPASEHPYLEAVHSAVAHGACQQDSEQASVSCDDLLRTYQIRATNLQRFHTRHAVQLCRDVTNFCTRLSTSRGHTARFHGFRVTGGGHYLFVERTDTHELLGAMQTVSKLDVSPEEWQHLWGAAYV